MSISSLYFVFYLRTADPLDMASDADEGAGVIALEGAPEGAALRLCAM